MTPTEQIIELSKQLDHLELRSLATALMHTAYKAETIRENAIKAALNR